MLFAIELPTWQPHPEVWALLAAMVALGFYTARVIGPKVVPAHQEVVTTRQKRAFAGAVFLLYVAADWPMHDIAEEYLYSVHMIQHLLITFVVPPLLMMAIPTWLARLVILEGGKVSAVLQRLAKPVVAGVIFNALAALTHWSAVVNLSSESGGFHYIIHLAIFTSALLMWLPVIGPLPELRLSQGGRLIYLFLMSIIPTIPAAWLTFADGVVYSAYDKPGTSLWGIDVIDDQQTAGFVMKTLGGFYLWGWIATLYFRWAGRAEKSNRPGPGSANGRRPEDRAREAERLARAEHAKATGQPVAVGAEAVADGELTFADVQAEFAKSTPPTVDEDL